MRLTGATNFRPLPRVGAALFRSDHLGALDDHDASQIRALGVRRVLDFRGMQERSSAACALTDVTVHSLAIEPTVVQVLKDMLVQGRELAADEMVVLMEDTYRNFVRHSTHRFAEFFTHLLESDEPTVFHCTAGKDRTGFAAALVLRALDVPQAEVMRDYLLTNERLKMSAAAHAGWRLPEHSIRVLYGVQPSFLLAAFEAIDQDYDGLEGYFREGLGLREPERERLRELYMPRSRA